MVDFKGKGNPAPEYQLGSCQHLKENYGLGQMGSIVESLIMTTLQDMIGKDPKAKFPYHINSAISLLSMGICSSPNCCATVSAVLRGF